jgi:hypothetical protein
MCRDAEQGSLTDCSGQRGGPRRDLRVERRCSSVVRFRSRSGSAGGGGLRSWAGPARAAASLLESNVTYRASARRHRSTRHQVGVLNHVPTTGQTAPARSARAGRAARRARPARYRHPAPGPGASGPYRGSGDDGDRRAVDGVVDLPEVVVDEHAGGQGLGDVGYARRCGRTSSSTGLCW